MKLVSTAQQIAIKSVTLHQVRVPLIEPFRISNGEVSEKDVILIELQTDDGMAGWGEASPMSGSFYSDDTPESTWQTLNELLIPSTLKEHAVEVPRFYELLRSLPGNAFARAGLEGAMWDAYARTLGEPLCELLGGSVRPIASGVAIGIYDSITELIDRVERYVAEGYRRVKVKIEPGWDIEPVAAIRTRFPDISLMVDANAAYTIADVAVLLELDTYRLTMIEQPLAREAHEEAAELQRQLRTPLCADESADSTEALASVITKRAARIINIKVQRVGGLSEARLMLKTARAAGLECWVGTMPELGIASAQALHLATLDGFTYPTDIEASARWYVDDVIEPAIEIDEQGFIHLPAGPGMGYQVCRGKIARYLITTKEFTV